MQVLIFFGILSLVVLVHELGHLFAAKFFGVRVDEFGFGLPPKLFRVFRKGGTDYTINVLPIGGFVKLYGENGEKELDVPQSQAFWSKPVWQRAIVVVAGVVMNFVLSVLLFAVVYSFLGIPTKLDGVRVEEVRENSPAATVGLREGDIITRINETEVRETDAFLKMIDQEKGNKIELLIQGDPERKITVVPRVSPPEGEGSLGVVIGDSELRKYPWWQMPFRGAVVGFGEAVSWGKQILGGFGEMIYRIFTGKGIEKEALAGPIGIYQITGQVSAAGILPLLQFVGILSVNLAILNIMPFPALDGGRLVFLFIELVTGKKVKEVIESWINSVGMVILLALMLVITGNDLLRVVGGWSGLVANLGF